MARRTLLMLGTCAALLWVRYARRTFRTIEVAGESMSPALRPGEFLLVRRGLPREAAGRIVYLHAESGRPLVKRIVGVPGESLRVGDHVEVNGHTLVEDYAHGTVPARSYRGVNQLGPDEYFVLGDNRGASTDSRHFGPVGQDAIEGIVWLRYWPLARLGPVAHSPRRRFKRLATEGIDGPETPVPLRHGERFGTTS
ncbi:MAG: signal peptidase I [Dehalococcoidia bacterium]